jgi:hypothetical protein
MSQISAGQTKKTRKNKLGEAKSTELNEREMLKKFPAAAQYLSENPGEFMVR